LARLSKTKLTESAQHIAYEVEMTVGLIAKFHRLAELFETLDSNTTDPVAKEMLEIVGRNAMVESFGTHVRALAEFLYEDQNTGKSNYLTASDFVTPPTRWKSERPEEPAELGRLMGRVSQEIAHLTLKRPSTPELWQYDEIWDKTLRPALAKFVDVAGRESLGDDAYERLAKAVRPPMQLTTDSSPLDAHLRELGLGATTADHSHQSFQGTATSMDLPPGQIYELRSGDDDSRPGG
jgi:hypothetical protein